MTHRLRITLEKHFGAVNALRAIPDYDNGRASTARNGELASFVSAGRDSMINIWTADGDCVGTQSGHRGTVNFLSEVNYNLMYKHSLQGSPVMVSLGGDNSMKLWDLKKFRSICTIPLPTNVGVITKAIWANQAIVTCSTTGSIEMWNYNYNSTSGSGSVSNSLDNISLSDSIADANANTNSIINDWTSTELGNHSHPCTDLISTDSFIASASKGGQIFVWNFNQG